MKGTPCKSDDQKLQAKTPWQTSQEMCLKILEKYADYSRHFDTVSTVKKGC